MLCDYYYCIWLMCSLVMYAWRWNTTYTWCISTTTSWHRISRHIWMCRWTEENTTRKRTEYIHQLRCDLISIWWSSTDVLRLRSQSKIVPVTLIIAWSNQMANNRRDRTAQHYTVINNNNSDRKGRKKKQSTCSAEETSKAKKKSETKHNQTWPVMS